MRYNTLGTDHGVDQIRRTLKMVDEHPDRPEEVKSMMDYLSINADNSIMELPM